MNIFKGKKIFAVLIALTLVLSSVPINSVNAKTNINNSEISVQLVNSTSIKVVAGKQTGYISVTKAKNGIKYVKGFESGKKPIVLKVDTKNGTVTSKNGVVFKINSVASDGKKSKVCDEKIFLRKNKKCIRRGFWCNGSSNGFSSISFSFGTDCSRYDTSIIYISWRNNWTYFLGNERI